MQPFLSFITFFVFVIKSLDRNVKIFAISLDKLDFILVHDLLILDIHIFFLKFKTVLLFCCQGISFWSYTEDFFIFHRFFSFALDFTFLISRHKAHFSCGFRQFCVQHLDSKWILWPAYGLGHFSFTFLSHRTPIIISWVWQLHHLCHVFCSFRFLHAFYKFRVDASQTPLPIFIFSSLAQLGYYLFSFVW